MYLQVVLNLSTESNEVLKKKKRLLVICRDRHGRDHRSLAGRRFILTVVHSVRNRLWVLAADGWWW